MPMSALIWSAEPVIPSWILHYLPISKSSRCSCHPDLVLVGSSSIFANPVRVYWSPCTLVKATMRWLVSGTLCICWLAWWKDLCGCIVVSEHDGTSLGCCGGTVFHLVVSKTTFTLLCYYYSMGQMVMLRIIGYQEKVLI